MKTLQRKGPKYYTNFYGYDNGGWDARVGYVMGYQKAGYDWEMVTGMSSRNEWRSFQVDGATEHSAGFRKALKGIVHQYPEVLDFLVQFDGPYLEVRKLVGAGGAPSSGPSAPSESSGSFRWEALTFYHGTSADAWQAIKSSGALKPRGETNVKPAYGVGSGAGAGRSDAVYLTTQLNMAHMAARDASKDESYPVILEVKGLDGSRMAADEDSGETDAERSLARLGSVAYLAAIPVQKIRLLEMWVGGKWMKLVAGRVVARWLTQVAK